MKRGPEGGGRGRGGRLDLVLYVLAALPLLLSASAATAPDPFSTRLWSLITSLGYEEAYVGLSIILYYIASPWAGFSSALSVLVSGSLVIGLKEIIALPRPPNPRVPEQGYAFPSGHTQVSSSFWSSAALTLRRRSILILGVSVVLAVSLSRIALNVHYPRDVAGGALVGSAVGLLITKAVTAEDRTIKKTAALAMPVVSFATGMAVYMLIVKDPTLLKISGVSIGILAHSLLFGKYKDLRASFGRRLAGLALSLLVSAALIMVSRGFSGAALLTSYALIGASIPTIAWAAFGRKGSSSSSLAL